MRGKKSTDLLFFFFITLLQQKAADRSQQLLGLLSSIQSKMNQSFR